MNEYAEEDKIMTGNNKLYPRKITANTKKNWKHSFAFAMTAKTLAPPLS